ncbi:hypothetical protein TUZN_1293 [Thermoproteus uzoniensis 768-20]|uniref:DUF6884 domain-containing protein n=1 Tax=Thermoproteus uzoniensis (strain 768-20) TaxID=999630 RepID=F2L0V4_THEU7|nr:DUF6884 domain-containing protein [Thermoproteus uzoniensis]AEA12769.1 hypothetical protein TUZN_1293 [Thermoproteus uzoniensis 768-20]
MPLVSWDEVTPEELKRRYRGGPLLMLTHCTKTKNVEWRAVAEALASAGLPTPGMDLEREELYRSALRGFVKPAAEMYGGSFKKVREIAEAVARCLPVDLYILSARYGLIRADELVVPYEATLNGLNAAELARWAEARGVWDKAVELLEKGYGMYVAFLPGNYARALGPALGKMLASENALLLIPQRLAGRSPRALVVKNRGIFSRYGDLSNARRLLEKALCDQY